MPELFKLLARNCILGIAAGWTTLAVLLSTNTGGLGDVVFSSANPMLPIFVLGVGFAITFGSISMGGAVMTMPYDRDDGKGRGLGAFTLPAMFKAWLTRRQQEEVMQPIPVKNERKSGSRR